MTQRIAFSILVPALLVTVAASAAPSVLQLWDAKQSILPRSSMAWMAIS